VFRRAAIIGSGTIGTINEDVEYTDSNLIVHPENEVPHSRHHTSKRKKESSIKEITKPTGEKRDRREKKEYQAPDTFKIRLFDRKDVIAERESEMCRYCCKNKFLVVILPCCCCVCKECIRRHNTSNESKCAICNERITSAEELSL
jgi:hypothetical protein